jgi:protein-arginine kinase activator protein McsA
VLAILKCIYNKRIVSDIYPMIVLNYLLSTAVEEEEYEYAAELKKIINK